MLPKYPIEKCLERVLRGIWVCHYEIWLKKTVIVFHFPTVKIIHTSWCSGRLIGSPRQRSRVQDPISTINIHEGGHWFQNPTRCGVLIALTNSSEFSHEKDVKPIALRVSINWMLDRLISPRRHIGILILTVKLTKKKY
jgi:hypothetical protein